VKFAFGSVEPGAVPPLFPVMAPAVVALTTRATLPATMSQLVAFPEQVLRMMILPVPSTSMPRSASEQLLPSMRLSKLRPPERYGPGLLPVRVAPAASISTLLPPPVLLPEALQKATTPLVARMPSLPLLDAFEFMTVLPEALIPEPPLFEASQPRTVLDGAKMPLLPLFDAVQSPTVPPTLMPVPPLLLALQP